MRALLYYTRDYDLFVQYTFFFFFFFWFCSSSVEALIRSIELYNAKFLQVYASMKRMDPQAS